MLIKLINYFVSLWIRWFNFGLMSFFNVNLIVFVDFGIENINLLLIVFVIVWDNNVCVLIFLI